MRVETHYDDGSTYVYIRNVGDDDLSVKFNAGECSSGSWKIVNQNVRIRIGTMTEHDRIQIGDRYGEAPFEFYGDDTDAVLLQHISRRVIDIVRIFEHMVAHVRTMQDCLTAGGLVQLLAIVFIRKSRSMVLDSCVADMLKFARKRLTVLVTACQFTSQWTGLCADISAYADRSTGTLASYACTYGECTGDGRDGRRDGDWFSIRFHTLTDDQDSILDIILYYGFRLKVPEGTLLRSASTSGAILQILRMSPEELEHHPAAVCQQYVRALQQAVLCAKADWYLQGDAEEWNWKTVVNAVQKLHLFQAKNAHATTVLSTQIMAGLAARRTAALRDCLLERAIAPDRVMRSGCMDPSSPWLETSAPMVLPEPDVPALDPGRLRRLCAEEAVIQAEAAL